MTDQHPKEGDIIDVWVGYLTEETGFLTGYRLINAWVCNGHILHGKNCAYVNGATHWMYCPSPPTIKLAYHE
jgi:hypothetical protein